MSAARPTVCFCSIAFRDRPLTEIIPLLAAAGYDGVEIWANHLDGIRDAELDDLRLLANDHGVQPTVIAPYFWLTRDLPELLEESYRIAERSVAQARRLGASRIRTFVDAGGDGIGSAVATADHWNRAVAALQRITALAPELLFVVETHSWTLADTPASTLRLLERVGAPNLVVNYQPDGGDPMPGYRLLRPHIRHLHLQNPAAADAPGYLEEGTSPLLPLLAALRQDGYTGTLSVEYCWKGVEPARAASARAWLAQHGI